MLFWSSIQWNGFIYNSSGNQIEILSTTFNCDSVTEYFLTVNDTPTVSINIGDTTICMDSSIFIYASGADNFSWDGNITNNDYNIILDNGTYTVTGTDTNNCQSSSSVTITVDTCYTEPFTLKSQMCLHQIMMVKMTVFLWRGQAWNCIAQLFLTDGVKLSFKQTITVHGMAD